MSEQVVIVGGGFSGLAAGVALSERGYEVLLLERRNHLGGRAYSFIDSRTGDVVDNGQHLFMGCYHQTIAFLEKIGCRDRLMFQDSPRVEFLDKELGLIGFKCPALPAPLHALAGLLRMRGLSVGDKLRALKVGSALRSGGNSSDQAGQNHLTVDGWLDHLGQSDRIKRRFWYPMAIAVLNEDPKIASAAMMKKVLQLAFDGSRSNTSIGIARVGLSDLYTEGARNFIESRGGEIQTLAVAQKLIIEDDRVIAVEMKDGERVEGDHFITAVPPAAFFDLLPYERRAGEFASVASLQSSPIVSINLWFDQPVIERDFVGLLGTNAQWIFNKDAIIDSSMRSNQTAVIISAARDFVDWTKAALVEMALAELREMVPASRSATLLHSVIVKEREATIAHTTASDDLRPGARTSVSNLFLAGDWTNTGLPATIESAVMSGNIAAYCISGSRK